MHVLFLLLAHFFFFLSVWLSEHQYLSRNKTITKSLEWNPKNQDPLAQKLIVGHCLLGSNKYLSPVIQEASLQGVPLQSKWENLCKHVTRQCLSLT